jgi:hypothetical protein
MENENQAPCKMCRKSCQLYVVRWSVSVAAAASGTSVAPVGKSLQHKLETSSATLAPQVAVLMLQTHPTFFNSIRFSSVAKLDFRCKFFTDIGKPVISTKLHPNPKIRFIIILKIITLHPNFYVAIEIC